MSHKAATTKSYPVANGDAIRRVRQSLDWTQAELAERSGYSTRLIQKAESGGKLAPGTLDILSQAFSEGGQSVSIDDLRATPESVARSLIAAINEHYGDVVKKARHLFHPEVVLDCAGDPAEIPFAGVHRGIDAVDRFYETFAAVLTPSPQGVMQNFRYLAKGNEVIAWGEGYAKVAEVPGPAPMVWLWLRLEIVDGQVRHYENQFDTQTGSAHLAETRARELLDKPANS